MSHFLPYFENYALNPPPSMKKTAVTLPNPHSMASMVFTMGSVFIASGYFLGIE